MIFGYLSANRFRRLLCVSYNRYILPGVLRVNSDNLLHIHYSYSHRCYSCVSSRIWILIFYKNQELVYFTPGNWNPRIFSFQQRVRTSSVQANLVSWSGRVDRKVVLCAQHTHLLYLTSHKVPSSVKYTISIIIASMSGT